MTRHTGAEITVRLLERQDVATIAGIPGGAVLPLYDALARSRTIRHVLARHEQGAGFIAQGIARVTGRPGVCIASSGPGATNLLTAIADAKLDSIPLVAITGQVPRAMIGTDAFQEVDTFGLSLPITKHNYLVQTASDLTRVIPEAFAIASSGRPGPVLIDIPKDVQTEMAEVADWPEPGAAAPLEAAPDSAIARAAAMIEAAERPILYLGGGIVHSGAASAAVAVAERSALPTVMTLMGLGALPTDHPLSLGMLGMHGAPYTNRALDECDLLIAVGARFDDRATGKLAEFCPRAAVIHVDIDAAELGKLRSPELAIRGDARGVLERLLPRLRKRPRSRWLARVAQLQRSHPLHLPELDSVRSPYGLIRAVAAALDDDRDRHDGRGSTPDVGRAGIPAAPRAQLAHLGRPRHDGLRLAGRDRRRARGARSNGRVLLGRRFHPDERAGARDRCGGGREREDRAAEQPLARARVSATDVVLRPTRVRVCVS